MLNIIKKLILIPIVIIITAIGCFFTGVKLLAICIIDNLEAILVYKGDIFLFQTIYAHMHSVSQIFKAVKD